MIISIISALLPIEDEQESDLGEKYIKESDHKNSSEISWDTEEWT